MVEECESCNLAISMETPMQSMIHTQAFRAASEPGLQWPNEQIFRCCTLKDFPHYLSGCTRYKTSKVNTYKVAHARVCCVSLQKKTDNFTQVTKAILLEFYAGRHTPGAEPLTSFSASHQEDTVSPTTNSLSRNSSRLLSSSVCTAVSEKSTGPFCMKFRRSKLLSSNATF